MQAKTQRAVDFAWVPGRERVPRHGDGPRVSQAKTERGVDFAWVLETTPERATVEGGVAIAAAEG